MANKLSLVSEPHVRRDERANSSALANSGQNANNDGRASNKKSAGNNARASHELRLFGVVEESIVDGPGIRYVIFTQGCPHHCPGCHNPQSWPTEGGETRDIEELFVDIATNPLLSGVTFSGGEPFEQAGALATLAKKIKAHGLHLMTYTGYLFEDLIARNDDAMNALLALTDVLVDGPFVMAQRDLTLSFRGSRNQRLIDVAQTRLAGQVVLAELVKERM